MIRRRVNVAGCLDVSVGRNAFGSQVDSAEVHMPWLTPAGDEVVIDTAFIHCAGVTALVRSVQVTRVRERIVGVCVRAA